MNIDFQEIKAAFGLWLDSYQANPEDFYSVEDNYEGKAMDEIAALQAEKFIGYIEQVKGV